MTEINELPDEVIEYILSKVPPYTDLRKCQLVCKRWKILVENVLRYTRMNLNRGLADFRLCWKSLDALETNCTIAGRFGHSAVVHEDSMYVFGGNSSTKTNFNDLWKFDLCKRRWSRLSSMSTYPSPKSAASIVCYRDHLVLFGGRRIVTLYHGWKSFDELHMYSIKTNKWTEQTLTNRPPPMAGHSASAHENKMVVFGGYQYNDGVYTNSNDIWCLDLVNFCWSKPSISELKPLPRYGQFQTALDDDNLLIVGGCGGPNNMFSDAWVLNMTGDVWNWRKVNVKNERFSGTHMWCNPACRVGNKLVVLGPTRSLPSDFQTIKQQMPQSINRLRPEIRREENPGWFRNLRQVDDVPVNRHNNANRLRNDPININNNNNNNRNYNANLNNIINNNNNVNNEAAAIRINGILNRAANEDDAVSRLQKNLALRYRDDGMKLPKRFDEPVQDRFKLAAFNNDHEERRIDSRERQQERIRRMESKMQALQNSRRIAAGPKREESNTRVKKNCIAIFVCDISNVLAMEPCMEWLEYKNYGIVSGAPERLVFSTIVHGNGELIMFGGVKKESLSDVNVKYQVSNTLYFLSAPRPVI